MNEEIHIASLIVHTRPGRADAVRARLLEEPGIEVPAADGHGKLVVTVEAAGIAEMSRRMEWINQIEGLLSSTLVYHHSETAEALEEVIHDEDHAP
ncbi:MAG: chaperone NapD [Gammaproteobacteria bacterium]